MKRIQVKMESGAERREMRTVEFLWLRRSLRVDDDDDEDWMI